jgi:hypothetical protein
MKKDNTLMYVILAVGIILIIGGGFYLFKRNKGSKCDDAVSSIKSLISKAKDKMNPIPCVEECATECFTGSLTKDGKIDYSKLCTCLKKCDLSKCTDENTKKVIKDWLDCDCKDAKDVMPVTPELLAMVALLKKA